MKKIHFSTANHPDQWWADDYGGVIKFASEVDAKAAERLFNDITARAEVAPQFVKIGILHRRRTGDVDFLQEAEVIPLGLHETLDVYATSQCMNSKP